MACEDEREMRIDWVMKKNKKSEIPWDACIIEPADRYNGPGGVFMAFT
jgi:hypothetical protein